MPQRDTISVLVFWTEYCDEMAATAFTIILRRSGISVRLVGLTHSRTAGANGVVLLPDFTLEQAIESAHGASIVVIPGGASVVRKLNDDPRVGELLEGIRTQRVLFVSRADASTEVAALTGADLPRLESYVDDDGAIQLAHRLAANMTAAAPGRGSLQASSHLGWSEQRVT